MWYYNGEEVRSLSKDIAYFVYVITYTDGMRYIGMKSVWTERRLKPLVGMRKNARRVKLTESKWKSYRGSSKLCKGKVIEKKEILYLCINKRAATYLELKEIVVNDALFRDDYINKNLLGRFYDNSIDGLKG